MTLKQVAKKCGVSETYLAEVEAGTRIIADDQARRILKTMGLKDHTETDFTLDDIAATVDLQSAMPKAAKAVQKAAEEKKGKAGAADANVNIDGSIWLDALSGVLKHVPVYNAVMKETGSRLLPVKNGQIEGAAADKVFYFSAPDNDLRGFRIQQGDLVLVVPAASPIDRAIMLVETPQGKMLRAVRLMPRFQVMLQRYDQSFESDMHNIADLHFLGRAVRLEADLSQGV